MVFEGPGYNVPKDRLGKVLHSRIRVVFEKQFINNIPSDLKMEARTKFITSTLDDFEEYIIQEAIEYFNKFLSSYRIVTNSFWLRPLITEDVSSFRIKSITNEGQEKEWSVKKTGGWVTAGNISRSDEHRLRGVLIHDIKPTLGKQLKLQVEDQIDLGKYGLAVISIDRMFEVVLRRKFIQLKEIEGMSPTEARERIKHPSGKYFGLDNFMDAIKSDFGFDYESTQQYRNYCKYGRGLRNKVVHEGYTASKDDAMYANLYAERALKSFIAGFIPEFGRWDILWEYLDYR